MKKLGLTTYTEQKLTDNNIDTSQLARVVIVHKERYVLSDGESIFNAELTGNMRFSANDSFDFPAVGDWVQIMKIDSQNAVIISLVQRYSFLARKAAGSVNKSQLIASNIDYAFITMSVTNDFNLNRVERYVSLCDTGNVKPIVLLTKTDLVKAEEQELLTEAVKHRFDDIPVFSTTIAQAETFSTLKQLMRPNQTYCFVGSSGVGKSTIINHLQNSSQLKTMSISQSTQKGRHTTTHRQLFVLDNLSIVIDTPGMREVGITATTVHSSNCFSKISTLSEKCRYKNCSHSNELGCAVIAALKEGTLPKEEYENFLRIQKEEKFYIETLSQKKRRKKDLSKTIRRYKKEQNK